MKKKYEKPQAFFESFELSANIAAGCAPNSRAHYSEGSCSYELGGMFLFTDRIKECTTPIDDGGDFCYHVPNDSLSKIFSS